MRSRPVVNALAAAGVSAALLLASTTADAGSAETAALVTVPSTWTSATPGQHNASRAWDVVTFDRQAWAVGTNYYEFPASQAGIVQHCVKSGCSRQTLPKRPTFGSSVAGITGTSPTDLWAYGWYHSAANTESPMIWRNTGGSWAFASTKGIVGDAAVIDISLSPSGRPWAIVIEDFDGATWVAYRWTGSRWVQVNPIDDPVFPGPCQSNPEAWYDIGWSELVFVGGRPTLVGQCRPESLILTRQGGAWKRIDAGLPQVSNWTNAAVVNKQLWVQGVQDDGSIVIARRASGAWLTVPTTGIPTNATISDMAGTVAKNLWLAGHTTVGIGAEAVDDAVSWRWTGTIWRQVDPPSSAGDAASFASVAAVGFKPAWIVGSTRITDPTKQGLILREK